jgi:hypothetical protein
VKFGGGANVFVRNSRGGSVLGGLGGLGGGCLARFLDPALDLPPPSASSGLLAFKPEPALSPAAALATLWAQKPAAVAAAFTASSFHRGELAAWMNAELLAEPSSSSSSTSNSTSTSTSPASSAAAGACGGLAGRCGAGQRDKAFFAAFAEPGSLSALQGLPPCPAREMLLDFALRCCAEGLALEQAMGFVFFFFFLSVFATHAHDLVGVVVCNKKKREKKRSLFELQTQNENNPEPGTHLFVPPLPPPSPHSPGARSFG